MMRTPLETPRLFLRPLGEEHLIDLGDLFGDPGATWDFRTLGIEPPDARSTLTRNLERYQREGVGHCAIHRKSDGAFLGLAGLLVQEVDGRTELEVGYRLFGRHHRQGYATEAARAWCEYGFATFARERIIALIIPSNASSIAVATRLGMTLATVTTWHRVPGPVCVYAKSSAGATRASTVP